MTFMLVNSSFFTRFIGLHFPLILPEPSAGSTTTTSFTHVEFCTCSQTSSPGSSLSKPLEPPIPHRAKPAPRWSNHTPLPSPPPPPSPIFCPRTAKTRSGNEIKPSDFVGIIPILLENPESRPICDRDSKNPDFDSCYDIFVKFS